MKLVENLFKKAYGENSIIEKTYVVGTHWNCLQHMSLKIRKKTIWKFINTKYHVHCLYLFETSQTANQ